jgi:tetratricopeptide (TPR) repeat protein
VLEILTHEKPSAIADLDAASRAASKEDGVRLQIGRSYQEAGEHRRAILEYDQWLASHEEDVKQAQGLTMRCNARAELGQELDKALSDCDAALRRLTGAQRLAALQTRGLVRLRRNELDKAIEDYNAALKLAPHDAWALYGRGLAWARKGAAAAAQTDLAAARTQLPGIEQEYRKLELTP